MGYNGDSPEARRRIANSSSSNPALGSERICYLLFAICYSTASFGRAAAVPTVRSYLQKMTNQ
jgi:hypothetical protein